MANHDFTPEKLEEFGEVFEDLDQAKARLDVAALTLNTANYASCTGLTTNASGVVQCAVSDERTKQNVFAFNSGLETLRKIRPVTFQFTPKLGDLPSPYYEGGARRLGFTAQNLREANPLLAREVTGQRLLAPDPAALAAVQTQALRELDAQVQRLSAVVEAQGAEIRRLRGRLPRR